ncbi:MAG: hypothetical protein RIS76_3734 [Verrucomicrobiota bacterium]|jgi:ribosome-associated heat shock protein Hsp15
MCESGGNSILRTGSAMRLDQWIWAVRLYRTRTLATDAVRSGHVRIDGKPAKPARPVRPGEVIAAITGSTTRAYRVVGHPVTRVGAPEVAKYAEDITPPLPTRAPDDPFHPVPIRRPRGTGRPTKRERRILENLLTPED